MIKELFYDFLGYNTQIFTYINHTTNDQVTQTILSNISSLFYYYNFIPYFAVACIYSYFKARKDPKSFDGYFDYLFRSGVIYCYFMFVFTLLKHTVNMPRPICSLPPETFQSIAHISDVRCHSSFPSAHSGFAVLVTCLLWKYLDHMQKFVMIMLIALTGVARISMAMHFPSDVIYGYIIAVLVVIIGGRMHSSYLSGGFFYCYFEKYFRKQMFGSK